MSLQNRRTLLLGAATSLGLASLPGRALAQTFDGFDDDRLYQDGNGQLYRRQGGQYVPYNGRVSNGRPVPDSQTDLDAEAYARRRAERAGEPPAAEAPNQTPRQQQAGYPVPPQEPDNGPIDYTRAYAAIANEPFPVQAIPYKKFNPVFLRQEVDFRTAEPPGTIVIDPRAHFLYLVLPNGRARRYGVGVGKQGFSWSGTATVNSKQAWPDWYPPKEMIARRPDLAREVDKLQSGLGVPGGSRNPLGARAMYLWQNNKDTLFRIHGTLEPHSIGKSVSSGCIRMINQDAIDLFNRVEVGARVVVLG
ncbi:MULTISPECIES: L,D-transpeptidase [unclassified Methylobacterium]|uniref:L,D-transpeptidase n=1 Tax=unclassified Methylobacterium TaxID=2615210 RepID=UPI0036FADBF5